jgi:hypothetical protein
MTTHPSQPGEHTLPWNDRILFTGMTGPTTTCMGGPTVEEQCAYSDYWRTPEPRDKTAYPKSKHTPIGYGLTVTAIAVGENHKERAALIVAAVNSHAQSQARIASLEGALRGVAAVASQVAVGLRAKEINMSAALLENVCDKARLALNHPPQ